MTNELPAAAVAAMIGHMNADHADSVLGYVHAYTDLANATEATLLKLDASGMDIEAHVGGVRHDVRVSFDHELRDADDARDTLIAMARTGG
jgi:putative heme iron utilization protein